MSLFLLGYYCPGNAQSPIPPDDENVPWIRPCTVGHFCPTGTGTPQPCDPGTYTTVTHQPECEICPEGFQCKGKTCS